MDGLLEVPHLEDLRDFGIKIDPSEQPGVVSLTASANDGETVTLTWDVIARSVSIRWLGSDGDRLLVTRENGAGWQGYRQILWRRDVADFLLAASPRDFTLDALTPLGPASNTSPTRVGERDA